MLGADCGKVRNREREHSHKVTAGRSGVTNVVNQYRPARLKRSDSVRTICEIAAKRPERISWESLRRCTAPGWGQPFLCRNEWRRFWPASAVPDRAGAGRSESVSAG